MANGARVAEVPIQYRRRIGKKKLKPWHGISIASKIISLAYRLNPALPLTLSGALLTAPGAAEARGAAPHSSGEGGAGSSHSLHCVAGHSRLLPRRRRRKYSQQTGPVGLLRPGRSRPHTTRQHGNPPQTLSFLKRIEIIPWMLKSLSGL